MKKYTSITAILLLIISLSGCEKDYDETTRITYFPNFDFEEEVFVELDEQFIADVVATEDGNNLEVEIAEIDGLMSGTVNQVDVTVPDRYMVTYSATNSDGYEGTASQYVNVAKNGDFLTSIEGLYLASVQKGPDFEESSQYTNMKYIFIVKTGDKTYEISDALGGYYFIGRNYGYSYAAQDAVITLNDIATNDVSITQSTIPGWGLSVDIIDFTIDAASKEIAFTGSASFSDFRIQLKQVGF